MDFRMSFKKNLPYKVLLNAGKKFMNIIGGIESALLPEVVINSSLILDNNRYIVTFSIREIS
jgi:hypothetical protein